MKASQKENHIQQANTAGSRFAQKLEAENKENARKKRMKDKELARQKEIVKNRGLKNDYIIPSFVFSLIGGILILFPAGIDNQIQWWYVTPTLICGVIGYVLNFKARKINVKYYQRYRAYVNPGLMKAGLYLSSFTLFGVMIIIMTLIPIYFKL